MLGRTTSECVQGWTHNDGSGRRATRGPRVAGRSSGVRRRLRRAGPARTGTDGGGRPHAGGVCGLAGSSRRGVDRGRPSLLAEPRPRAARAGASRREAADASDATREGDPSAAPAPQTRREPRRVMRRHGLGTAGRCTRGRRAVPRGAGGIETIWVSRSGRSDLVAVPPRASPAASRATKVRQGGRSCRSRPAWIEAHLSEFSVTSAEMEHALGSRRRLPDVASALRLPRTSTAVGADPVLSCRPRYEDGRRRVAAAAIRPAGPEGYHAGEVNLAVNRRSACRPGRVRTVSPVRSEIVGPVTATTSCWSSGVGVAWERIRHGRRRPATSRSRS